MNMFSKKVSEIISFSKEEAERLNSPNLTPEHLLLGILRDKDNSVKSMMKSLNIFIIKAYSFKNVFLNSLL